MITGLAIGYLTLAAVCFVWLYWIKPKAPIATALLSIVWPLTLCIMLAFAVLDEYRQAKEGR